MDVVDENAEDGIVNKTRVTSVSAETPIEFDPIRQG